MLAHSDQNRIHVCYYCDRSLGTQYDYPCVSCTRQTCDYEGVFKVLNLH